MMTEFERLALSGAHINFFCYDELFREPRLNTIPGLYTLIMLYIAGEIDGKQYPIQEFFIRSVRFDKKNYTMQVSIIHKYNRSLKFEIEYDFARGSIQINGQILNFKQTNSLTKDYIFTIADLFDLYSEVIEEVIESFDSFGSISCSAYSDFTGALHNSLRYLKLAFLMKLLNDSNAVKSDDILSERLEPLRKLFNSEQITKNAYLIDVCFDKQNQAIKVLTLNGLYKVVLP